MPIKIVTDKQTPLFDLKCYDLSCNYFPKQKRNIT